MVKKSDQSFEPRRRPDDYSLMHQDWRHLLFLHWKYSPEEIQKTLPKGLTVDTYKNDAYLTITPFLIKNLHLTNLPNIPGLSSFIEVNLRTYVIDDHGVPGIWFYSLDLNSFLGVNAARLAYSLPYYFAELTSKDTDKGLFIEGKRINEPAVTMQFSYKPSSNSGFFAQENSLDFFLIERYVLFACRGDQLHLARVHHEPYPLKEVNVINFTQNINKAQGFELLNQPDYTHYSYGVDVDFFGLKKVN